MSADDELDYMSDAFVCTNVEADIRPGLNPKHKRKKQEEQPQPKKVSVKFLEKEKRDDGLQTPIASDNKGFAMLAKMGFKPGSGLGKSGAGRAEPVPINVKIDRKGLGRNLPKVVTTKKKSNEGPSIDDYRKRVSGVVNIRYCKMDLAKSQKICYALDSKQEITPDEEWFWPEFCKEGSDKQDENDEEVYEDDEELMDTELTIQDKLHIVTQYLRRTYFYCIWCGTQYDDEKDLQNECPGPTKEDH